MRSISIIGGGIAGLSLGILLRREGIPVTVWDSVGYPRHRVCGEFLSGLGSEPLTDLLGGSKLPLRFTSTTRFFVGAESTETFPLPSSGIALSRWALDKSLADQFVNSGGELRENERWTGGFRKEGVVRASGRRTHAPDAHWCGVKMHASGISLSADLEMHFSESGYLGLLRLPEGEVNFCALVRLGSDLSTVRRDPAQFFAQFIGDATRDAWAGGEFDRASLCTVAGISLAGGIAEAPSECRIGDSLQVIPPFTGNGMSLAIESAFLAAPWLKLYHRGELDWAGAVREIAEQCKRRFRTRLGVASLLQRVAEKRWTRRMMLSSLRTVPPIARICFRYTR